LIKNSNKPELGLSMKKIKNEALTSEGNPGDILPYVQSKIVMLRLAISRYVFAKETARRYGLGELISTFF